MTVSEDSRDELVRLLNEARQAKNLSIRAVAKLAGVPAATAQGWLQGRHLPTPALRPSFQRLLDVLELDIPEALWQRDVVPPVFSKQATRVPYLGLRPFDVEDADLFYGRAAEARRLADAIAAQTNGKGIVALIGGSGTGKSSLLAAGLLGGECVAGILAGRSATLITPESLHAGIDTDLVIIDQFEDVFAASEEDISATMDVVADLAKRGIVVLGLRSDAFGPAAAQPVLAGALAHPVLISDPSREEIAAAVTGPAEVVGYQVEPELVTALLNDVAPRGAEGQLGARVLPLLSTALLATWAATQTTRLSVADYYRTGGIASAVEGLAEDVFAGLTAAQQDAAHELFIHLVSVQEGGVVRIKLPLADLEGDARTTAERFIESRLLTSHEGEVAISHDALLAYWPRLSTWIEDGRDALRVHEKLRQATALWLANDRDPASLLPVSRLPLFADFAANPPPHERLSSDEREFLAASEEHFSTQLDNERRVSASLRRQRAFVALLAAIALVAATVAGVAQVRTRSVQRDAQSRQLAYQVESMGSGDTFLAGQLAIAAADLAPTVEARSQVLDAVVSDLPLRWVGYGPSVLAASADGTVLARADSEGQVTIWRGEQVLADEGQRFVVDQAEASLFAVDVVAIDGRLLLAAGGIGHASLWDVTDEPEQLAEFDMSDRTAYAVAFHPGQRQLAVGDSAGETLVYSLDNPQDPVQTQRLVIEGSVSDISFDPVRPVVYVSGAPGVIDRWETTGSSWEQLPGLAYAVEDRTPRGQSLAVSPDGRWLVAGLASRTGMKWDLAAEDPQPIANSSYTSWVNSVQFVDDETYITGDSGQRVLVFDAETDEIKRALTGPGVFTGALSLQGRPVAVDTAGTLRVWQPQSPILRSSGATIFQLTSDAAGTKFLAGSANVDNQVLLWSLADGVTPLPDPVLPPELQITSNLSMDPGGAWLWAGANSGQLIAWPLVPQGAGEPQVHQIGAPEDTIGVMADPTGTLLSVTIGNDAGGQIKVFRVGTDGELVEQSQLPAPMVQAHCFSSDSQTLAVGSAENKVVLWSLADGSQARQLATIELDSAPVMHACAANKPWVAIGTDGGVVEIWDLTNAEAPELVREFTSSQAAVYALQFNATADKLLGAGGDAVFYVWDLTDPADRVQYSVGGGVDRTNEVRFVNDGSRFVGTYSDGSVKVWPLDADATRDRICSQRGTPLSAEEWNRHVVGIDQVDPCE